MQPKAQLISDPVRLVIDLPGTTVGRPESRQTSDTGIREIRVGQFQPTIARIVVEVSPGYTIDPSEVKFRGRSPSQWTVDIPEPTLATAAAPDPLPTPPEPLPSDAAVLVRQLQVASDGFFLPTSG